jgi:hypothetical protein
MVRHRVNKSVLGIVVGGVLVLLACGAAPAFALSPWWHLSSTSDPTYLQPGQAKDEVQEVTVSATAEEFVLIDGTAFAKLEFFNKKGEPQFAFFKWDATSREMEEGLEGIYGVGKVHVSGGPGDEEGTKPYVITWPRQQVEPMVTDSFFNHLNCEGATGSQCKKEATVKEVARGQSDGQILVTAVNLGDANANPETQPVTLADKLPAGLQAVKIEGDAGELLGDSAHRNKNPLECSLESLSCTYTGATEMKILPPYTPIEMRITVKLTNAKSGELNQASVTGGGAASATTRQPIVVSGSPTPFGVRAYEVRPEEEGGGVDTQAGSHPFQLTTTFALNETLEGQGAGFGEERGLAKPVAMAKDLHFKLPPGLIGNPAPFAQCTLSQFLGIEHVYGTNYCSAQTVVGVARVEVNLNITGPQVGSIAVPLFNLEPSVGEPARFGFLAGAVPVILDTAVRTGGDYGVTVNVSNITQQVEFLGSEVTFWGVPGDPRHDNQRNWHCLGIPRGESFGVGTCDPFEAHHPPPLIALPTSCTGPLQTTVEADSWKQQGSFLSFPNTDPMPALDGCNRLLFNPSINVAPDGQAGSTPSGLTVGVHVPQDVSLNATGLSEADVKDTTVALPAGVTLNPAAADGLQACSEEQVALSVDAAASCPEAAKVGTLEIKSPLLPNALTGEAYLAEQNANPFGSLVALYLVAQDPVSGVLVKLAGEVKPDPVTGQLLSTFKNTPQLPFEDLKLHFFGGDRAPLSTPGLCGAYTTTASISPWSGNEPVDSNSTFDVISGPNGTPCSAPLPFNPSLTAGTTSIQAGGFSPFTMTMSRPDGSQNLEAIKLRMPPGLLGTLATVKLCKEAQANAGTCGPESLIGHTTVSVGVGGDPYSVTGGEVFITEGYKGAPYGLSIVNPAKAGPFDLGKVIVRAKIEVDPITAVLTITSDSTGPYKIPTILDGIPLQIQHVNVSIDRKGFTFNPTNSSPLAITGSLTSDQSAVKDLSVPFQITNCAVLAFKPKLTAKTNGKTSRAKGASLSVKLTYPAGPYDANIAKVKVDLPKQLPSRLTTLQKACPAATFQANPANCPAASIVGHATATTPVMPVPLTGPAYFVSHGGEAFPDLIIVLQGYGATVHLVGTTFISKTGITSSTFKQVPDVPVGTFELTLPQGKYSALAANGNLCTTTKLTMPTQFIAQNGAVIKTTTPIVPTGCAKHAKAKKNANKAGKHHKGSTHGKKK